MSLQTHVILANCALDFTHSKMEGGVRRNIALKLKPSGKDSGTLSEGSRKKEAAVRDAAATVEDVAPSSPPPPPPPAPDHQTSPLPYQDLPTSSTTVTTGTTGTRHTSITSASGKVPPESSVETGQWLVLVNLEYPEIPLQGLL